MQLAMQADRVRKPDIGRAGSKALLPAPSFQEKYNDKVQLRRASIYRNRLRHDAALLTRLACVLAQGLGGFEVDIAFRL